MTQPLSLNGLDVTIVSDGVIYADGAGPFGLVPRTTWAKLLPPDELNRVPMRLHCLLVRDGGHTIVVDTGLGDKLSERELGHWRVERPEGTLLEGLARAGVAPDDVDLVLNTHLHADHCGWNTRVVDGQAVATFPRAEYWVQRVEYEEASHPNERTRNTYFAANFAPLAAAGQLRLVDGDTPVTPHVRLAVTPGHTRGHQCVLLESGGGAALYVADLASYAIHFERLAWLTAFDVEPLVNLETKRRWQRWALEHDARLIFEHDPHITVGRLVQEGERLRVVAV